jgi:hypothetical protein
MFRAIDWLVFFRLLGTLVFMAFALFVIYSTFWAWGLYAIDELTKALGG